MESEQDRLVAASLYAGDSPTVACKRAGYAQSTIRQRAGKICRSERVQARLREISRNIHTNELTDLGRARIKQKLCSSEKNDKVMLGYIRTGAELEGALGNHPSAEFHLHAHATLPPGVQQMLEDKMREILAEESAAFDTEVVTQAETTPKPASAQTTPPEPLQEEKLTTEEKQNRWLAFQAALPKNRMPDSI
jgi:hypothetical protein